VKKKKKKKKGKIKGKYFSLCSFSLATDYNSLGVAEMVSVFECG